MKIKHLQGITKSKTGRQTWKHIFGNLSKRTEKNIPKPNHTPYFLTEQ